MNKAGRFTKISLRTFVKDWTKCFPVNETDIPADQILDEIGDIYDNIKMPKRATYGSAGYDLYTPIPLVLEPGQEVFMPTGLRCEMEEGYFLMIVPRSGQGTKFKLRLANTAGIVDSDYAGTDDTQGHIFMKLCNEGDKTFEIDAGTACAQMIFIPFGITADDDQDEHEVRTGGHGSTDKR